MDARKERNREKVAGDERSRRFRESADDDGVAEGESAGRASGEPGVSTEGEVADAGTCTGLGKGRG